MADLYLCVDPGGSQTKIIYQLHGQPKPQYLLMPPEVEQITACALNSYFDSLGWIGSPAPIQQIWLEVDDDVFVVGAFANKFDPTDRLVELKYENALYKVLAAVGLIREIHELSPRKKLALQLSILLPWNEYNDRQRFQEKIDTMLSQFSFRGQACKVRLEKFLCRPEGGGLAAIRILQQGIDWLRQRKLEVLMLGHRNTTALYFEYGELKQGDSPLIGFSKLLDRVIERTSGLNRERLARAIFQGIESASEQIYIVNQEYSTSPDAYTQHPNWSQIEAIKGLASAKDAHLWQQEVSDIASAIDVATQEYWSKLSKWLNRVLPSDLDEVVISGGAARFLEPELEAYFNCEPQLEYPKGTNRRDRRVCSGKYKALDYKSHLTPIVWGAGLQQQVAAVFSLSEQKHSEQSLSYRLVDAYGLFDYLIAKNSASKTPKSGAES